MLAKPTCQMRCTTSQSCARYPGCFPPRRRSGSELPRGYDHFPFGAEALRPARLGNSLEVPTLAGAFGCSEMPDSRGILSTGASIAGSLQGLIFNNH